MDTGTPLFLSKIQYLLLYSIPLNIIMRVRIVHDCRKRAGRFDVEMLLINYQNTFHPQRVSSFTPMKIHTCNSVPVSVSPTKPVARQQTKSWKSVYNLTKSSFFTVYIFPEKMKLRKCVQLFINSQQWNIIFDEPVIERLFCQ